MGPVGQGSGLVIDAIAAANAGVDLFLFGPTNRDWQGIVPASWSSPAALVALVAACALPKIAERLIDTAKRIEMGVHIEAVPGASGEYPENSVNRLVEGGYEVLLLPFPALLTVVKEISFPQSPEPQTSFTVPMKKVKMKVPTRMPRPVPKK